MRFQHESRVKRWWLGCAVTVVGGCSTATTAAHTDCAVDRVTAPDVATDAAANDASDGATPPQGAIELVALPAGSFEMGDHIGNGGMDPRHPSDELPLHTVRLSAFEIARTETTCAAYVSFLSAALARGEVAVREGLVVSAANGAVYSDTADVAAPNCVTWREGRFGVADGRAQHPVSGVRWIGAAAFANWYGATLGLDACYRLPTGETDWTRRCVRLPTEAEWEYAGRGASEVYRDYPWGDDRDDARVNWVGSGDPWEQGPAPQTTPVGFFDGSLRHRADFGWPASVESYQTHDGRNGFGLFDMAGNVWEWVNDWYGRAYYAESVAQDPTGPAAGDPMPDGQPYRNLRGGCFFNSTLYRGDHERVSNRDPAYFRGRYMDTDDPNGPWFHIGFRVVRAGPRGGGG